jgi:hypothetical protein
MRKIITEDYVQDNIVKYLCKNKWGRNPEIKKGHAHGVDIKVTNNSYGRDWLIECKGDASKKAKRPSSSREGSFNHVFGQIITRMKTKGNRGYKYGNKYSIGFPSSFRALVLKRLPYNVCYKLTLSVFIVTGDGKVEYYDWKKLKVLQNK